MAELLPMAQQEKGSTENAKKEPSISEQHAEDQTVYLNGKTLALVMIALYSATFLVALVRFSAFEVHHDQETETDRTSRIVRSLRRLFPASPMTSTP